jgi:hypothetical protein
LAIIVAHFQEAAFGRVPNSSSLGFWVNSSKGSKKFTIQLSCVKIYDSF